MKKNEGNLCSPESAASAGNRIRIAPRSVRSESMGCSPRSLYFFLLTASMLPNTIWWDFVGSVEWESRLIDLDDIWRRWKEWIWLLTSYWLLSAWLGHEDSHGSSLSSMRLVIKPTRIGETIGLGWECPRRSEDGGVSVGEGWGKGDVFLFIRLSIIWSYENLPYVYEVMFGSDGAYGRVDSWPVSMVTEASS